MANTDARVTSLEHLSVEIFLEIFVSLTLNEINTAFSGLNSHIDSIIRSVRTATHTVTYNDAKAVQLVQSFPTQINRLILTHSPTVDVTPLGNLRSLTLKYGTLTQFDAIRPEHFPQLEILHLCGINGSSMADKRRSLDDLFQVILSNGFPRLRICTAVGFDSLSPNNTWSGSPSLRVFILDLRTPFDDGHIRSLCPNLRDYEPSHQCTLDFDLGASAGRKKAILKQVIQLKAWESEKQFVMEHWSTFNTTDDRQSPNTVVPVIRGRIFPRSDPYSFASFLIEIKLPTDYPFKPPEATILDRIYHPNIRDNGRHCCCWGFDVHTGWSPAVQLVGFIKGMIRVIDNIDLDSHCDKTRSAEYEHNYEQFHEKALRCTIDHGRPRF